jgi:hypothetical protein
MSYIQNGRQHSNFSPSRRDSLEAPGRKVVESFFEYWDLDLIPNDVDEYGYHDSNRCDYRIEKPRYMFIEAETKSDKLWPCTQAGLHIPNRKLKYIIADIADHPFYHFMVKSDQTEFYVTYGEVFLRAGQYPGYFGMHEIESSDGFVIPDDGLYNVKKWCKRDDGWEENDFCNIPLKYTTHYKVIVPGKEYERLRKAIRP